MLSDVTLCMYLYVYVLCVSMLVMSVFSAALHYVVYVCDVCMCAMLSLVTVRYVCVYAMLCLCV